MYKYQSCLRVSESTDVCLYYLDNKVLREFNTGLSSDMILNELQNAFNTINHDILFNPLHMIVFSPYTNDWSIFCLTETLLWQLKILIRVCQIFKWNITSFYFRSFNFSNLRQWCCKCSLIRPTALCRQLSSRISAPR